MTEWVLVVTIIWAVGLEHNADSQATGYKFRMPSKEVCLEAKTKEFPSYTSGDRAILVAECRELDPQE